MQKTVNVLIVGAGPAGMAAALHLKKLGINDILLVERERVAGGATRFCNHPGFGFEDLRRLFSGPGYARYYRRQIEKAKIC